MSTEKSPLWCANDAEHPPHRQGNVYNGFDYCSGRPKAANPVSTERPEDYLFSDGPQPERVDWLGMIPADVLAAHDREVAAKALEDAADAYYNKVGGSKARPWARVFLRHRAADIRKGML